jgi:hypothetical protein
LRFSDLVFESGVSAAAPRLAMEIICRKGVAFLQQRPDQGEWLMFFMRFWQIAADRGRYVGAWCDVCERKPAIDRLDNEVVY